MPDTPEQQAAAAPSPSPPVWAPWLGGAGAAVGAVSLVWVAAARPEFGGLADRLAHFQAEVSGDRVFWAFCVDSGLYAVWQAVLLGAVGAAPRYRLVPFAGLAAWLLAGCPRERGEQQGAGRAAS